MVFLRWLLGGMIGGIIGGAVWVAIGYNLEAEVGYIAWAIGFLCGLGVQLVGGEEDGFLPGFVAVGCAATSILASKYLVIALLMNGMMTGQAPTFSDEDMVASFAEEILFEQEEAGKTVKLPAAYDDENAPVEKQYPRKIWRDAEKRWDKLSTTEQEDQKQSQTEMFAAAMSSMKGTLTQSAFRESFNLFDLLWFGLAAFTAFRVGSGLVSDDD